MFSDVSLDEASSPALLEVSIALSRGCLLIVVMPEVMMLLVLVVERLVKLLWLLRVLQDAAIAEVDARNVLICPLIGNW